MTHVLVVDDERALRQALAINLRARNYDVTAVGDGAAALAAAARHPPDVVILDLGLPDMDGNDVIEGLRGWSQAPIIVLSARTTQGDKVVALDVGADDYMTKPFGMDELLARLRAALRRTGTDPDAPMVETKSFTIDLATKQASTPAGPVRLTPTEWHLLEVLIRHDGKLVSPPRPAPGGLGPGLRDRDQLPAGLHGAATAQARARPLPSASSDHRARDRLQVRARVALAST